MNEPVPDAVPFDNCCNGHEWLDTATATLEQEQLTKVLPTLLYPTLISIAQPRRKRNTTRIANAIGCFCAAPNAFA